ncbi:glycosyltransferase [Rubrivirga sp. S365]|uniref:Glycosyltransferase n=1 Tax=Rubrivirga litoralis TaxID=3075598 RepID=A0ABU3BPI1_9BACT|nr:MULTISPECIES: glycosyltransferase [unclassified Rubrivirga]MDT0631199.1 glycosyltransferase [Rubrivirga sp. F394]MDT7856658.1 glycosyltransferase [Rubrivirga sp. S365]
MERSLEEQAVPRVSVLMAVYNGEQYLAEALDSVLAQTLSDIEIVVVDDASTDGTAAILADYAARDGRLVVLRNEENRKLAASLNRGLAACRAPLVARADADDVNMPDRLEKQVAFLERHPEVGVLGSGFHRIGPGGEYLYSKGYAEDHETIRARQLFSGSLLHPSVVFRADVVRGVGGYDESYWTAQDTDLWARLHDRTRFANLPDTLVHYRTHGTSVVRTRGKAGLRLSLRVSQPLLEDRLERTLTDEEVAAVVTLYRGHHALNPAGVRVGLPLLREVLQRVRQTEPPAAAQSLRREAAASLLAQGGRHGLRDPRALRALLCSAAALDPRLLASRRMARLLPRAIGLHSAEPPAR